MTHAVRTAYLADTTPLPTDPDAWNTLSEEEQKQVYKDYAALNKTPGVSVNTY